ncbi:MAG: NAD(+)/NADH kinase [Anaerolineales bacterium]
MRVPAGPPQRFAVASHPQIEDARKLAGVIADHLRRAGLQADHGSLQDEALRRKVQADQVDMLIALGGDGTMLRAGHLCAGHVPILGINLGRFGFLTEVRRDQWEPVLGRVCAGEFWLEQRMMLRADLRRGGKDIGSWNVLNECLVGRGETVRPVQLIAEIDGQTLTTYVADGLIAATATGSTAYALAAGGPILPPELRNILLVPVAPHLSVDRAIVLHEGSSVSITVCTTHQAILSADGGPPVHLEDRDRVEARAADVGAEFVRLQDPGYFYRNLTARMNQNPAAEA